jgi:hypothetical protein
MPGQKLLHLSLGLKACGMQQIQIVWRKHGLEQPQCRQMQLTAT